MDVDGLAFISVIVGFGLVIAAGAWLGAGSSAGLAGLFTSNESRDRPVGVQETDVPHFALGSTAVRTAAEPRPEIEELYAGPIRPAH